MWDEQGFKPSRGYLGCAISQLAFAGKSATLTRPFSGFTVDPRTIEAILAYKTHIILTRRVHENYGI